MWDILLGGFSSSNSCTHFFQKPICLKTTGWKAATFPFKHKVGSLWFSPFHLTTDLQMKAHLVAKINTININTFSMIHWQSSDSWTTAGLDSAALWGESQGWVSFFCLDLKVWMLLLLGPGSAAASHLQSCQWSHFGFVTGTVTWDLPAKLTTWISLFGLQGLLFYAATDFLPILPLHSGNLFDLNKEEGSWRSLVLLWAHLADVGLASHRVSVSLLNGVVGTTAALQMATKAERC